MWYKGRSCYKVSHSWIYAYPLTYIHVHNNFYQIIKLIRQCLLYPIITKQLKTFRKHERPFENTCIRSCDTIAVYYCFCSAKCLHSYNFNVLLKTVFMFAICFCMICDVCVGGLLNLNVFHKHNCDIAATLELCSFHSDLMQTRITLQNVLKLSFNLNRSTAYIYKIKLLIPNTEQTYHVVLLILSIKGGDVSVSHNFV